MELLDSLYARHSVRAFSARPVPESLIHTLLGHALQSPSWSNTQPFKVAIATGGVRDAIAHELSDKYIKISKLQREPKWKQAALGFLQGILPDGDFNAAPAYPRELQARRVATGKGLYQLLGIARHDLTARDAQMARNFEFFDAPVAMFVFVHAGLKEYSVLDAGIFLQSLMLAAHDAGLGTCAQGALALWRSPVAKHFNIPKDYKLICGLSLGYAAEDKINQFRPDRRTVDEILIPAKA